MLNMTYEYKLIPSAEQIAAIEKNLETCRLIWNFGLRERKDWFLSRKSPINACSIISEYILPPDAPFPSYNHQAKHLTLAKKEYPNLAEIHSQVPQQTLRTLERAFDDMQSKGLGFPRFKKQGKMRSFVYPQVGKNPIRNDAVKLPQLGWVCWRMSRPIPEGMEVKQARIVKKASGYFVMLSLQLDIDIPDMFPHGHPLGIDIGLDKYVATSDGQFVDRPRFLDTLQSQIKLLQRRLKTKKKGSKNWHKLNQKIARLHQKVSDTRKDWQFKLAHQLCDQAGMIFVEDINFKSWASNMLAKHNLDGSFGQFFTILEWVCWRRGVYFAKVDKNYTSQICPNCSAHTGKKELSQREHNCPECGYKTNRDVAAAMVIRERGISAVGQAVVQNVSGDVLSGTSSNTSPGKSLRVRKLQG